MANALSLTARDFEQAFPKLKVYCGQNLELVERRIDEAVAFTNVSGLGDTQAAYVALRKARWLLHLDGCSFASKEQAKAFKASLDRAAFVIGCRIV